MQIDVRWQPRHSDGGIVLDRSFSGLSHEVQTYVLRYIERSYLCQTTLKHPDRAEATRFWNFSLADVSKAFQDAVTQAIALGVNHLWIDISHRRIQISLAGDSRSGVSSGLTPRNSLASVQAHPLYIAPFEKLEAGGAR